MSVDILSFQPTNINKNHEYNANHHYFFQPTPINHRYSSKPTAPFPSHPSSIPPAKVHRVVKVLQGFALLPFPPSCPVLCVVNMHPK